MFPSCGFHRQRITFPCEQATSSTLTTADLFVCMDSWAQTQSKYAFAINFSRSQTEAQRVCAMPSFILRRLIAHCIFLISMCFFLSLFPVLVLILFCCTAIFYALIPHQALHFYANLCFSSSTMPFGDPSFSHVWVGFIRIPLSPPSLPSTQRTEYLPLPPPRAGLGRVLPRPQSASTPAGCNGDVPWHRALPDAQGRR